MIKNTDEQLDEEMHRVRYGMVPRAGVSSVPVDRPPSQCVDVFTYLKVLERRTMEILRRFPHVDIINYKLHFQHL